MNKNELKQLAGALDQYSKAELVDLLQHIIRLYVLQEALPVSKSTVAPASIDALKGLTFRQLLSTLQSSLELEELSRFSITPQTIMVDIGGQLIDLNGPAPALAASQKREDEEDEERAPWEDDEEEETRDPIDSKPWRTASAPKSNRTKRSSGKGVETAAMTDLFVESDRSRDRNAIFSFDPPEPAPPIAQNAPGDVVEDSPATSTDFAKTAQSRDEEPSAQTPPPPPELAEGDKQIDPSNRYGSLDFDD